MSGRIAAALAIVVLGQGLALGDSSSTWDTISNISAAALWASGLASSVVQDGRLGPAHAARTFDGFAVDGALTLGLQSVIRERGPYNSGSMSFPSMHASLSFEIAAAQSYYHHSQAPFWYGAAAFVSYSRIPAHEHHWQDVLAGGLLGYGCGQLSVSSRHGWLLAPTVQRRSEGVSLEFRSRF